jgi:hypothetical protein
MVVKKHRRWARKATGGTSSWYAFVHQSRMATGGWWQRNRHGYGKNSRAREGMNQTHPKIISPFFTWIIAHLAPPPLFLVLLHHVKITWVHKKQLNFNILVYQNSYYSLKIFQAWLDKTSLLHAVYQCEFLLFHVRIRSRYSSESDSAWASAGSIGTIVSKTGLVSDPVRWLAHWFTSPTGGSAGLIAIKNYPI